MAEDPVQTSTPRAVPRSHNTCHRPALELGAHHRNQLQPHEWGRAVQREDEQAQAASARWPPSPDLSTDIQHLTREMHISDVNRNTLAELERALPSGEEDTSETLRQPPAVGLISRQQDTYFIPPPSRAVGGARGRSVPVTPPSRAVGGARGRSVPVSMATLGLIHRQDPALAALLREEPASLMTQRTRRKVYSTIRLLRSGLIGQMASLQQWEKAMNDQDEL